jgi:hypothetical protein
VYRDAIGIISGGKMDYTAVGAVLSIVGYGLLTYLFIRPYELAEKAEKARLSAYKSRSYK